MQSSPCPPPHQTPRPSQPSSVPPKPHRKVSAFDPRRHLEGPMPRDLATRVWCVSLSRPTGPLPCSGPKLSKLPPSPHPFPQQPTPIQSPHPATLSSPALTDHPEAYPMPHKSPTSSRGLRKDKETAWTMHSSRDGASEGEQRGSAHQARVVGRGGRSAWWGEGHHSKKGVRRLLWDSRWLLLYLSRCSLSNSLFCTCKCCAIFQS